MCLKAYLCSVLVKGCAFFYLCHCVLILGIIAQIVEEILFIVFLNNKKIATDSWK